MTFREFEYFLAVTEEKNITKAAEKLHVSQPSLTQQLQRLEKELDCKLLIRTNSGVKLTDAGNAYHRMARQMMSVYESFQYEIGQLKNLECGKLRIGASWYITTTWLTKILAEYSQLYPNIEIDCLENRTSVLLESLNAGQIDLAVISQYPNEPAAASKRFVYHHLYRDYFCVISSPKRKLRALKMPDDASSYPLIDVKTLSNEPFIMFRNNQRIRQITDRILMQADMQPQIKLTTYGFPMAIEQVATNMGIAILPQGYLEIIKDHYDIEVFSLPEQYFAYWDISVCHQSFDIMPFPLKAFCQLLKPAPAITAKSKENS